ncbi:MAG: hypothetical protein NTY02_05610 [Acidobacteria bacterium]|nr:hypothetical protein [Acidobacteriota bacterium]
MPGTVARMPWKFRLKPSGIAASWMLSTTRPVSDRSVCMSGVSPVTVTVSDSSPIASATSTRMLVLTASRIASRTTVLKPCNAAFTL